MSNKILLIGLLTIVTFLIANLSVTIWFIFENNYKIGFVRSSELVYSYSGTKEVQNKFNIQSAVWKGKLDTLQKDYEETLHQFQLDYNKLTDNEKKERRNLLAFQEQNISGYNQNVQQKAKEDEKRLMEGVLNQINSFVQQYGQQYGYKIIFGTTSEGSVLYGEETIDLTETILNELNEKYK
ncbi:MAG: OmpH family outer membrane protein [Bacteroidia bacterium]|nr:OmpH family outer membrane protein [Bacteroidia bacterium]